MGQIRVMELYEKKRELQTEVRLILSEVFSKNFNSLIKEIEMYR
jgi:hypothetical protein